MTTTCQHSDVDGDCLADAERGRRLCSRHRKAAQRAASRQDAAGAVQRPSSARQVSPTAPAAQIGAKGPSSGLSDPIVDYVTADSQELLRRVLARPVTYETPPDPVPSEALPTFLRRRIRRDPFMR